MPTLTEARIASLLAPYLQPLDGCPLVAVPPDLFVQLGLYLDLLLRWNERTNLTAVRDAEIIVTRHFGESLLLARLLPPEAVTLLDLGSGAGFPGVPCQLLHPGLRVTLAESQGKKAAFLREVVRHLHLPTRVHAGRAEALSALSFDVVTLRAVDKMDRALLLAADLGRQVLLLTTTSGLCGLKVSVLRQIEVPHSESRVAALCVPRET